MKILLLGGTAEARVICAALRGHEIVLSLKGLTNAAVPEQVTLRKGGFGGSEGLERVLRAENFSRLIDATHPFASAMKRNAGMAANAAGIPFVHLIRPAWGAGIAGGERVGSMSAAARALAPGERAFLAIGAQHLQSFATRSDVHLVARSIMRAQIPQNITLLIARPPFSVEEEEQTFREHRIGTLVLRDSGGADGFSKVIAAQRLGLRIILIDRPEPPAGLVVEKAGDVLDWLAKGAQWSDAS